MGIQPRNANTIITSTSDIMRLSHYSLLLFSAIAVMLYTADASADNLVILHTNDTHSQIDPLPDGTGGLLRRKVLIDSIRDADKNVLLVDAGDIVQGSLYYSIYKGKVEREMVNALGYEIAILGNHEFDNGMDTLAHEWRQLNAELLCTNYDLTATPLNNLFKPYTIKVYDNKRIGFMGLNLDPKGMISPGTSRGVVYHDVIDTANKTAALLRDSLGVDYVIALTHIGYDSESPVTPSDSVLAIKSRGIDLIIGGHSHTELSTDDPTHTTRFHNSDNKEIVVAQTGSLGHNLGRIDFNLDNGTSNTALLPIDCRYDARIDTILAARVDYYRNGIINQVNEILAIAPTTIEKQSILHKNWIGDIAKNIGNELNGGNEVDLAIINKGGLRNGLQAGPVTVGMIMTMLPFDNRLVLLDIKGSDLEEAFKIMESRGGDAISNGFNRSDINPDAIYRIVTIDYLANGGDYMESLTRAKVIKTDIRRFDDAVIQYLRPLSGKQLPLPDINNRF